MAKSFDELVKRATTKKTRQRAAARAPQLLGELLLSEIRERAGKTQQEVAEALDIKQPSLSKLEKQSDMQISTLRRIAHALGGELEVAARFPAQAGPLPPAKWTYRSRASWEQVGHGDPADDQALPG